jgi:hypothetical protein
MKNVSLGKFIIVQASECNYTNLDGIAYYIMEHTIAYVVYCWLKCYVVHGFVYLYLHRYRHIHVSINSLHLVLGARCYSNDINFIDFLRQGLAMLPRLSFNSQAQMVLLSWVAGTTEMHATVPDTSNFFFFPSAGDWTHSLIHAKQAFYPWIIPPTRYYLFLCCYTGALLLEPYL